MATDSNLQRMHGRNHQMSRIFQPYPCLNPRYVYSSFLDMPPGSVWDLDLTP
jgi:hypothetical protein